LSNCCSRVQLKALLLTNTLLDGTVPCDWANAKLSGLTLTKNINLQGPLPVCFAGGDSSLRVQISNNSESAPFCGSGSGSDPVAAHLPKCSTLPDVIKARAAAATRASCYAVGLPRIGCCSR
jgi:hypothetical protein